MSQLPETPSSDASRSKNQGGRPKGSKTRPKWLREALKRPRGRPKGAKNKPKTLEAWLAQTLTERPKARAQRPPKDPVQAERGRKKWAKMTPEEISAHQHKASARAIATGKIKTARPGRPGGRTAWEHQIIEAEARADVKRIMNIMADEGILPEDPLAREGLEEVLRLMRAANSADFKLKAARTILEYRLAKPVSKSEVTLKSAEDFLDELAAKETDEPTAE